MQGRVGDRGDIGRDRDEDGNVDKELDRYYEEGMR